MNQAEYIQAISEAEEESEVDELMNEAVITLDLTDEEWDDLEIIADNRITHLRKGGGTMY